MLIQFQHFSISSYAMSDIVQIFNLSKMASKTGLKPVGPIAPNCAPRLNYPSIHNNTLRILQRIIGSAPRPIGPIAPNRAPRWSYLHSAIHVHTTTHCRFHRELHGHSWGSTPPKAGTGGKYLLEVEVKSSHLTRNVDKSIFVEKLYSI